MMDFSLAVIANGMPIVAATDDGSRIDQGRRRQ
jgi:hypothetical protein